MISEQKKCFEYEISEKREENITYIDVWDVEGFSVSKTFDCGQCFRFRPVEGSLHEEEFSGVVFGRFISVARDGDRLRIYNCDETFFKERLYCYLGLCDDYRAIRQDIANRCPTEYMLSVMENGEGIRILRQDSWEALCSFIISQNNNIARIKKIINALCQKCGEEIDASFMTEHGASEKEFAFPSPEAVMALGIDGLRELRVGFRASYIYDGARRVAYGETDLTKIQKSDWQTAISELTKIRGVGLKVASCTALFGMAKLEAFPIDVWIRRMLDEHFPKDFDPLLLGEYAGIAQQYMFYSATLKK